MSSWTVKRFWDRAEVVADDDGWHVELDGRRLRTPAKAAMILPTPALAEAVAAEWQAQQGEVDPGKMPMTRRANAAIDKVRSQHAEVADMLAEYGDADLLCYRADAPAGLVEAQAAAWDPALDWAESELGVRLIPRTGIVHAPQSAGDLARLRRMVHALTPFQLAGLHDLVSLSGSLILGFAAVRDWRPPGDIWQLSRLDEDWQQRQWGHDDEATAAAAAKRDGFLQAKRFFDFS